MAILFCPKCARITDDIGNSGGKECVDCKKETGGTQMIRLEQFTLPLPTVVGWVEKSCKIKQTIFEEYILPMGQFDDSLEIAKWNYEDIYGINGPATRRAHQRVLDIDAAVAYQQRMASMPKCPTCGSMSVVKMGAFERGMSIAFGGIFSNKINKTFRCNQCGYTW